MNGRLGVIKIPKSAHRPTSSYKVYISLSFFSEISYFFGSLSLRFIAHQKKKTFDFLEYQKVLKEFDFLARTFLFFEEKEPLR